LFINSHELNDEAQDQNLPVFPPERRIISVV